MDIPEEELETGDEALEKLPPLSKPKDEVNLDDISSDVQDQEAFKQKESKGGLQFHNKEVP